MVQITGEEIPEAVQIQVSKRIIDCFTVLNAELEVELSLPSFDFSIRDTDAGRAYGNANHIQLNPILYSENESAFYESIIPHEVAHIADYQLCGADTLPHGRTWQMLMKILDAPAEAKHSFDTTSIKLEPYMWRCPKCHTDITVCGRSHRRLQRGDYRHLSCDTPLTFVGIDVSNRCNAYASGSATTKLDRCVAIASQNVGLRRRDMLRLFVEVAGMTPAGAATYYHRIVQGADRP